MSKNILDGNLSLTMEQSFELSKWTRDLEGKDVPASLFIEVLRQLMVSKNIVKAALKQQLESEAVKAGWLNDEHSE